MIQYTHFYCLSLYIWRPNWLQEDDTGSCDEIPEQHLSRFLKDTENLQPTSAVFQLHQEDTIHRHVVELSNVNSSLV